MTRSLPDRCGAVLAMLVWASAVIVYSWSAPTAHADAPIGLTVRLQKDAVDSPLYALVSWDAAVPLATYEIQRTFVSSLNSPRTWVSVPSPSILVLDGRASFRDEYPVGSGGVCYRVKRANEASGFSTEACSPVPPTSGAPAPPATGDSLATADTFAWTTVIGVWLLITSSILSVAQSVARTRRLAGE